jgi:MSHA pilin protein MshD
MLRSPIRRHSEQSPLMRRQSAFTLIEIVVTIIVIGISATALLSVFTNMIRGSADPVIQQQATTIAEAYLEEIMLRAFDDPQGGESGGAEGVEARPTYDDVQDYNSLGTTQVRDQNNNPVAALNDYQVTVTVNGAVLNGVAAMQIDVSVNHPLTGTITLSAFRTDY